jgi:hypothetical protein
VPWEVVVVSPGDDRAFSEMMFGLSRGILSFHVDESVRLIRIFNVVWIGWQRRSAYRRVIVCRAG